MKTKGVPQSNSFDSEYSSNLKWVFEEAQGVFRNSWLQKGVAISLDYRKMAVIFFDEEEETNSIVAESQTSNSFWANIASAYMMQGNLKKFMKRMDEHEIVIHKY